MFDAETAAGPPLERLDDGVAAIHEASISILEELGIEVRHARARQLLAAAGAAVGDDDVVRVPRSIVADAVDSAPSRFTLHARNPENDVVVGDGRPVRAPGYGPSHVHTLDGERRRARLADYERLVKLAQSEDALTCVGYRLCEPADVPRERRHLETLRRSLTLADKPVMASTTGAERARECLELVGIAVGDPDLGRPYVAGLVNTVPPRSTDEAMLAGLLAYADAGQPPVVTSFTMAGASGPPTVAGSVAQANAETLLGVTLTQLVEPGTPVVYGLSCSPVDDRHGSLSVGSPESALAVPLAAELGRAYGLPTRSGGGLTDAKAVDYQAGFESTFLQAVTAFGGVDFVLHAAGVLESYAAVSPGKFVLDCETLRYLDRFAEGYAVDEDALDLGTLAATEPAGHFLEATPDGRFHDPAIVDKRSHDDWGADGAPSVRERAHDRVRALLESYERPAIEPAVERELEAYVDARGG